jgi:hypothetical protein
LRESLGNIPGRPGRRSLKGDPAARSKNLV